MAELKRRVLKFSTGKQVKLYGNSIGIGRTLEIGEGYAPNVLAGNPEIPPDKNAAKVNNPYQLTQEEIMELADYMMALWLQLKENIRRYGSESAKVFLKETNR